MAFDKVGFERLWTHIIARLGNKVDKVEGKGLSTCDFTPSEKEKLSILKEHKQADWKNTIPEDEAFIANKPVTLENRTVVDYRGIPIDDKTYEIGFSWGPEYYYKVSDFVINNTNFFVGAQLATQDADGNIDWIDDFNVDQLNDLGGMIQFNTVMFFCYVPWEDWTPGIYSHVSNSMFRILAPTEVIREDAITNEIARKKDIVTPVQSDWNENDETSLAYVQNRTHWEKNENQLIISFTSNPGDIVKQNTYLGYSWDNSEAPVIYADKEYIVSYNNQISRLMATATLEGRFVALGNLSIHGSSSANNGLNYVYVFEPGNGAAFLVEGTQEQVEVSITEVNETIKQLDPKFIPTATEEQLISLLMDIDAFPAMTDSNGAVFTHNDAILLI